MFEPASQGTICEHVPLTREEVEVVASYRRFVSEQQNRPEA